MNSNYHFRTKNIIIFFVLPDGLKPSTWALEEPCSFQLSYRSLIYVSFYLYIKYNNFLTRILKHGIYPPLHCGQILYLSNLTC